MGLASAGRNGNNRWDWERNGNEPSLNLAAGIRMKSWEREGLGLKETFPLISD